MLPIELKENTHLEYVCWISPMTPHCASPTNDVAAEAVAAAIRTSFTVGRIPNITAIGTIDTTSRVATSFQAEELTEVGLLILFSPCV